MRKIFTARVRLQAFITLLLVLTTSVLLACGSEQPDATNNNFALVATATEVLGTPSVKATLAAPTSSNNIVTANVSVTISSWKQSWLSANTCKAPCWEGITPGKTTVEEGTKLLKQKPFVLSSSVRLASEISNGQNVSELGTVYWKWSDGSTQNSEFKFNKSSPDKIITQIAPYSPTVVAKLSDIIQVYGNPDYVEAHNSVAPAIQFLWLEKGLAIATNGKGGDKELNLTPSLSFVMPTFFIPQTLEQYLARGTLVVSQFIPWQGYKGFMFYCNASSTNRC